MSLRELFRSGQRVGGGLTRELYYWAGAASNLYGWARAALCLVCPTAVECSLLELCIMAPSHCKAPPVFFLRKKKEKTNKHREHSTCHDSNTAAVWLQQECTRHNRMIA